MEPSTKRPRGRPRKVRIEDNSANGTPEPRAGPSVPAPIAATPAPAQESASSLTHRAVDMMTQTGVCAACQVPSRAETSWTPLLHFLYCDNCPRAYHMGCLDPPFVDFTDYPTPNLEWFCPFCTGERNDPTLSSQSFQAPFDYLNSATDFESPTVYSLPDDVKAFFKDVITGPHGNYVNNAISKPAKADRHGYLEDRDPYRLRDRNNNMVLCYRCGHTALPPSKPVIPDSSPHNPRAGSSSSASLPVTHSSASTASRSTQGSRRIISCDFCHLSWHLDCLDPPLVAFPPPLKKWMCPNHMEHLLPLRRTPKQQKVVEVKERNVPNNGDIEVIPSAKPGGSGLGQQRYQEMWINSTRYMVPERTIRLDFLDKIADRRRREDMDFRIRRERVQKHLSTAHSETASSLTSLSDSDDVMSVNSDEPSATESNSSDEETRSTRIRNRITTRLEDLVAKSDAALSLLSLRDRRANGSLAIPDPNSLDALVEVALTETLALSSPLVPSRGINQIPTELPGGSPGTPGQASAKTPVPVAPATQTSRFQSPAKAAAGKTATSFRIQLNRGAATKTSTGPSSLDKPEPMPSAVKAAGPQTANGSTVSTASTETAPPLTPEEIAQLQSVRKLMAAKGKDKLMKFLTSSD